MNTKQRQRQQTAAPQLPSETIPTYPLRGNYIRLMAHATVLALLTHLQKPREQDTTPADATTEAETRRPTGE